MLAEMGLLGFGVMVWFIVVVYRGALARSETGCRRQRRGYLAALWAFTGILVHSFFDFNLQIPANAALFYVYARSPPAPPLLQRSRKRRPDPSDIEEEMFPASEVV